MIVQHLRIRAGRAMGCSLLGALTLVNACGSANATGGNGDQNAPPAQQFGVWQPGPTDTCTKEQHDAYSVVGPDGKRYPTWHGPTGPGGCTFGHEHGRDPRGSNLYSSVGDIPFGYANEQLNTAYDPANPRTEDHFGHKVEWENNVTISSGGIFTATCDVLTKLHQGTHSGDALTNNLHELFYAVRCSDGTEMRVTLMSAFGRPGEFRRSCDRNVAITAGAFSPANAPTGGGFRAIPDRFCVDKFMLTPPGQNSDYGSALHETWESSNSIEADGVGQVAFFNPYFQVSSPARFHDPNAVGNVGRAIDVCYETTADGRRAQGGMCARSTDSGRVQGVTYTDPRSEFNGADHFMDLNQNVIRNSGGPDVWYTDPFGKHGKREPFPGSIAQRISSRDSDIGGLDGPQLGRNRDYAGPGTRAPN